MKKFLLLITTLLLTTLIQINAFASEEISVYVDGIKIEFDVPPQIIDGRTMVPVRQIFEQLGMVIDWNSETQTVTAYKKGIMLHLVIDSNVVSRNFVDQSIDVPAKIIDGRTLVPVRVVSECAGANVSWDSETNSVYNNSTDSIKYLDWNENCYYWGETNGAYANGYGIIYDKTTNLPSRYGLFYHSEIIEGADTFHNGEYFKGKYANNGYQNGVYYYSDGAYYDGDFLNTKKHGKGILYYNSYTSLDGTWENDLPNGYMVYTDTRELYQAQGEYVNGKRHGEFTVFDYANNTSYKLQYDNGNLVDEYYLKSKNLNEFRQKFEELQNNYQETLNKIEEMRKELYEYTLLDPLETEEGKKIYNSMVSQYDTSGKVGGNIDSYAAANAMRQQAALKANAYNAAYEAQQSKIKNMSALIDQMAEQARQNYELQLNNLKMLYDIE